MLEEAAPHRPGRHALLAGTAVALFHALTAPSGLFWLDAGDFAAASCELGVPHPTGFPLYTLLGKLFCLMPIGSGAFRVALLSAALAGAASAAFVLLAQRLLPASPRPILTLSAIAASLIGLWTGGVAGLAGRTPDVYALHTALMLIATLLCLRLRPSSPPSDWLALGFAVGLGLSNHAEFRLFAPAFVAIALWRSWPSQTHPIRRQLSRLGVLIAAVPLGLLPHLYLPLAAARGPYHAWGQPDTWARFWDHVSGRSIRVAFGEEMLSTSGARLAHAAETFAEQAAVHLGALLPLALVGVWVIFVPRAAATAGSSPRPDRPAAVLLMALLTIDTVYAIAINPMGLRDQQNGLPAFALLSLLGAIALGAGINRLFANTHDTHTRLRLGLALLLVAGIAADSLRRAPWDELLQNRRFAAEDLGWDTLLPPPEGALVLTGSEAQAASRIYLVAWGALRPDLQALHRAELSDSLLLWRRHREGPFPLALEEEAERWPAWGLGTTFETYLARLDRLIDHAIAAGRTVRWGPGSADETRGRWERLTPDYPTFRFDTGDETVVHPAEVLQLEWAADPWSRRWAAEFFSYLGTFYVNRGLPELAFDTYSRAHILWPDWSPPLVNMAVLAARAGAFEEAAELARRATQCEPLNATAWLNLARYECVLGATAEAREALERGREVRPSHPSLDEVEAFIATCHQDGD